MGINMVVAQPNFMKCALSRGGRTLLLRATLLGGQLVCWVGNTSAPRFTPSQCQTGSDWGRTQSSLSAPALLLRNPHLLRQTQIREDVFQLGNQSLGILGIHRRHEVDSYAEVFACA